MSLRIKRDQRTIFIALPKGEGKLIKGGCQCPYCNQHPDEPPRWDTIAIDDQRSTVGGDWGHLVHYPELPR